ncbi:MAG: hypothetical protein AB7U75_14885 [Hyphomicrobiaceae bacterium]
MSFRPMLSADCKKPEQLKFPLLVSPKLDGIRCLIIDGIPTSRTLKHLPNVHIRTVLSELPIEGLDGELLVGDPTDPLAWNSSQSGIMSRDGTPDFIFHVFDDFTDTALPFKDRLASARERANKLPHFVRPVQHAEVRTLEELMQWEHNYVSVGYEGIMLRSLDGKYKYGRSTEKEGGLIKMKRFHDAEAEIVGFVERMHNENEAKVNALGLTERSSHKGNKTPMDTLGAFECSILASALDSGLPAEAVKFEVGTGMDDAFRAHVWRNRDAFLGKNLKFKFQQVTNTMKPRLPVYLGIREDE